MIVGQYRVESQIGSGTMGVVYEVEHLESGTRVALKVLASDDPDVASRLVREGKAMSLFHHRNIVELVDVGSLDDGTVFVATELVRGISLRDLLADGYVDPRRGLSIVRQVLDALGHAHGLGVIHRDVKPENIMLADGGNPDADLDLVKMLDFGLAKLALDTATLLGEGNLTRAGFELFGSPLYMAPEVALGRVVDARADLYAVGVILFELLAGKPPLDDPDIEALMRMQVASPIPTLRARAPERSFTPELEQLVSDALAKQPDLRFRSAGEMTLALDAAMCSLDEPPAVLHAGTAETPKLSATIVGQVPTQPPRAVTSKVNESPPIMPPWLLQRSPSIEIGRDGRPRWLRHQRRWLVALAGCFVVMISLAAAFSDGDELRAPRISSALTTPSTAPRPELAGRATDIIAADPARALELLERDLATPALRNDPATLLALGHARFTLGRRLEALAAYEHAVKLEPGLAADTRMRSNVIKLVDTHDVLAAIVALEHLATRVAPPAHEVIVAQASNGRIAEIRHRAFAIAEREGLADRVDRVESWSLDLLQVTTCDDRRVAVRRLRTTDRRAVPALRRARGQLKCVERDAGEAIGYLESIP